MRINLLFTEQGNYFILISYCVQLFLRQIGDHEWGSNSRLRWWWVEECKIPLPHPNTPTEMTYIVKMIYEAYDTAFMFNKNIKTKIKTFHTRLTKGTVYMITEIQYLIPRVAVKSTGGINLTANEVLCFSANVDPHN